MAARGKGRGRGKGRASIPVREKIVTRNRGKPTQSVLKKRSVTPPVKRTRKNNKGYLVNGKRPWEDSDGEIEPENIKAEYLIASSEEEDEENDEEEDIVEAEKVDSEPDEEEPDDDDSDVSFEIAPADDETILCPWIEENDIPELPLPRPCHDLIVSSTILMDLVQIYETVTTYYRLIQLTPFLFEDFCAAMRTESQSKLVAELHIALLRTILRDDDEEQTIYAVTETSVSFQLLFQLLEPVTYGEVLRQYAESDPRFPKEVVEILRMNYPYVSINDRVKVLFWLCERFHESAMLKKEIKTEGKILNESYCRECAKPGDLLLCDGCEASYHMKCLGLDDVPEGKWYCTVCQAQEVHGVTDCEISTEKGGMHRKEPLGYNRHGRVYWFLVRRLIVEDVSQNTVHVYSTIPAIYELISSLDASYYESRLCSNIYRILDTIAEQCSVTLKLTHFRRDELGSKLVGNKELEQTYIDKDNAHRMIYIVYNVVTSSKMKNEINDFDEGNTQDGIPKDLPIKLEKKILKHLGFENGRLVSTIWSFGVEQEHLVERRNDFVAALNYPPDIKALPLLEDYCRELNIAFRLSFSDGGYRKYDNIYDSNEYAKPTAQRIKERDRKKYMATRFSLDEPFMWAVTKGKNMFVDSNLCGRHIQITLRRIVERLPDELYHRLWKGHNKEVFVSKLTKATTPEALRECLLQFEAVLRKPTFTNAWWNSLGHTSLVRQTHGVRERRTALDNLKKKEERELAIAESSSNNDIIWVNYLRQKNICKNLWRMKNEQYRLNGKGALGGWMWISKMYTREVIGSSEKPELGINYDTPIEQLQTSASKKASKLDKLVKKLNCWREAQEEEHRLSLIPKCFSPSCGKSTSFVNGKPTECYSVNCPRRQFLSQNIESDTSANVKAFDPVRRRSFIAELKNKSSANTRGEGLPFPFPVPFHYTHPKTKQKSILMLPKYTLKKLAKTGGVKAIYIHGFNRSAKSNYNVWNYPAPRPVFDNCWRYLTHHATSLHAIALQLRILFASIRWADLEPDFDEGEKVTISHPDYDEKRFVIGHKEYPPDGYYEQYKLRVELIALDDDGIPPNLEGDVVVAKDKLDASYLSTPTTSSSSSKATRKSIRRKSKKSNDSTLSMRSNVARKFVERWIDGVELKLFEIVAYWKRYNEKKPQIRILKQAPSDNKELRRFSTLQGMPAPRRSPPLSSSSSSTDMSALRKRLRGDINDISPAIPNKIVVLDDSENGTNSTPTSTTTQQQTPRIITVDRRKQDLSGKTPVQQQHSRFEPRNIFPISSQNGSASTPRPPLKIVRRSADGSFRYPMSTISSISPMNSNQIFTVRPHRQVFTSGPRYNPPVYRTSYRPSHAVRRILVHPPGRQVFIRQTISPHPPTQLYSTQSHNGDTQ